MAFINSGEIFKQCHILWPLNNINVPSMYAPWNASQKNNLAMASFCRKLKETRKRPLERAHPSLKKFLLTNILQFFQYLISKLTESPCPKLRQTLTTIILYNPSKKFSFKSFKWGVKATRGQPTSIVATFRRSLSVELWHI